MEIKTRFAIGDRVWALRNCRAVEMEIASISITKRQSLPEQTAVTYCGNYGDNCFATACEGECFASKEELLKHILGDE